MIKIHDISKINLAKNLTNYFSDETRNEIESYILRNFQKGTIKDISFNMPVDFIENLFEYFDWEYIGETKKIPYEFLNNHMELIIEWFIDQAFVEEKERHKNEENFSRIPLTEGNHSLTTIIFASNFSEFLYNIQDSFSLNTKEDCELIFTFLNDKVAHNLHIQMPERLNEDYEVVNIYKIFHYIYKKAKDPFVEVIYNFFNLTQVDRDINSVDIANVQYFLSTKYFEKLITENSKWRKAFENLDFSEINIKIKEFFQDHSTLSYEVICMLIKNPKMNIYKKRALLMYCKNIPETVVDDFLDYANENRELTEEFQVMMTSCSALLCNHKIQLKMYKKLIDYAVLNINITGKYLLSYADRNEDINIGTYIKNEYGFNTLNLVILNVCQSIIEEHSNGILPPVLNPIWIFDAINQFYPTIETLSKLLLQLNSPHIITNIILFYNFTDYSLKELLFDKKFNRLKGHLRTIFSQDRKFEFEIEEIIFSIALSRTTNKLSYKFVNDTILQFGSLDDAAEYESGYQPKKFFNSEGPVYIPENMIKLTQYELIQRLKKIGRHQSYYDYKLAVILGALNNPGITDFTDDIGEYVITSINTVLLDGKQMEMYNEIISLICVRAKLSEKFLRNYWRILNWKLISQYQYLSKEFMIEFASTINLPKCKIYQTEYPFANESFDKYLEMEETNKLIDEFHERISTK